MLLFAWGASAQTMEDRAHVGVTFAGGTAIGAHGTELDARKQLDLRLPLPPVFMGRTVLVPSLGYETRWIGLEQRGPMANVSEESLGRRFHRFQLGLTLVRPLAPRWMLVTGVSSNTRTDFRDGFDFALDTSWAGFVMATYQVGGDPDVRLTFGLVGLYPFTTTPVVPMVGFVYRKGAYIIEVGLPRTSFLLKVGDGLELGLSGMFDQQMFRTPLPDEGRTTGARYVRETALRVGPMVNTRLGGGNLWLSSSLGLDLLNDYALLDKNRDRIDLDNLSDTKPAPYLRVSLGWRPPRRPVSTQRSFVAPGLAPSPMSPSGTPSLME
ncbi:hypothetical protein LZ198_04040 [Myxococcus sp. K15C18031901]|uniref:hypothetical protein n=1 Tax=Myxococcus dinghuensis TaxID=2906761 RepID=UPI0020A7148B|nr:hypothetical protein [Myxococcus dinghuensis]MCP3098045.1 hypothetical protein [Myxococcus dinghuensis]